MVQSPPQPPYTTSVTVPMPTAHGEFAMTVYTEVSNGREHIVLQMGNPQPDDAPLVRVHSECATGDLFGSRRCDCGAQLQNALRRIGEAGCGLVLYLRQEGRGIGLANKLRAYQLQDQGLDTVDANLRLGFAADERRYDLAAAILHSLGIQRLRLMTNNPAKVEGLLACGLTITERVAIEAGQVAENRDYLATKKMRMGHCLALAS